MKSKSTAARPVRTREHYLEDISRNYVEQIILRCGHTVDEPRSDYGYDLEMTTYDFGGDDRFTTGEVENGHIFMQLKATEAVRLLADGETIPLRIKRRHAVLWGSEPMPVYLIVYSVSADAAYWLHMQPYLKAPGFRLPPASHDEITVHVSHNSVLNPESIESFRRYKGSVVARIRKELDDLYAGH